MQLTKHGHTFITGWNQLTIPQKAKLLNISSDWSSESQDFKTRIMNSSKGSLLSIDNHYNSYVLLFDGSGNNSPIKFLVSGEWDDIQSYKNGKNKFKNEFNILFKNIVSSFNLMDILILKKYHESNSIGFDLIRRYYVKNLLNDGTVDRKTCYEYLNLFSDSGYFEDEKSTMFFKMLDETVMRSGNTNNDITIDKYTFLGARIMTCDYTDRKHLFFPRNENSTIVVIGGETICRE